MTSDADEIRVVDLFAGPGGLGEGFSAYVDGKKRRRFSLAISIEKDPWAHRTLKLRAFRRQWPETAPPEYHDFVAGRLSFEQLIRAHPTEGQAASDECRLLELGAENAQSVRQLIAQRLDGDRPWVLIGGPPCQAYSLIGRARNKGKAGYTAETDHRQTLYVEYLQVLADHAPPVFVMENVKGLLSARLGGDDLFRRIRGDLKNPAAAIKREGRRNPAQHPRYTLRTLNAPDAHSKTERASDYVVRSEDFGVPQARHRVIVLGIRDDFSGQPARYLEQHDAKRTVAMTIAGLPRVRSGLSKAGADSGNAWRAALRGTLARPWFRALSTEMRAPIRATLTGLAVPEADRGDEFIAPRGPGETPVLNHATRAHIVEDLERYLYSASFAEQHGRSPTLSDLPTELLPNHDSARRDGSGFFADRFRVQLAGRPSSTITSHIAKDGHYYIHFDPTQCRSLTVREAARLQTFPDDYFFCGPRTSQYQQVGNAVPPLLATQIAEVVAPLLGQ